MPELKFKNSFVSELSGDTSMDLRARATPNMHYAFVKPSSVSHPKLLAWSSELAALLPIIDMSEEEKAQVFSGNSEMPGMKSFATRYGGHQFGHWAGQLGDGRAIILGETESGWEIQLKGAGATPYSRRGDGRAVLRSSLREYICSEAMHYLGVPTTRALACVLTGDSVVRDMFYDGNARPELGAITTRLAPSFLRFGHFEIFARTGEIENLRRLVEYSIQHFFPTHSAESEEGIALWFGEILNRTALLMAHWQRLGFVHGVMNTDNLSILGLTIDYGPYGWLDVFDPEWTPNTTDAEHRRYCFGNQPNIAFWNLLKLAEALSPLVKNSSLLEKELQKFKTIFFEYHELFQGNKLGFQTVGESSTLLSQELLHLFGLSEVDPTIFYRLLAKSILEENQNEAFALLSPAFYAPLSGSIEKQYRDWLQKYFKALDLESGSRNAVAQKMNLTNPIFIPRNYLLQLAIDEIENGQEPKVLQNLILAMKNPYKENSATLPYFTKRPEWARNKPGCSALSCSS